MTRDDLIYYLWELGWEYQTKFTSYDEDLQNLIIYNINNKLNKERIRNWKSCIYIWNYPLWNLKTARYIILWTCPWEKTLFWNQCFKINNKNLAVYYCDVTNDFREIMKNLFPLWDDIITKIIEIIKKLNTSLNSFNRRNNLTKKDQKYDLSSHRDFFDDNIVENLNKLSELQEKFCKLTYVYLWDGVEVFFWLSSKDKDRKPIIYSDFWRLKDVTIIKNWWELGNLRTADLEALNFPDTALWNRNTWDIIDMEWIKKKINIRCTNEEIKFKDILLNEEDIVAYNNYKYTYLEDAWDLILWKKTKKLEKWWIIDSKNFVRIYLAPSTSGSNRKENSIRLNRRRRAIS